MRYLIDTNIFIYYATDKSLLSNDVLSILEDYNNTICISTESLRELIISFNSGGIVSRYWQSAHDIIDSIQQEWFITILPLNKEHMRTYSDLVLNELENHKDPSDHVIISHAITNKMPLISSDRKFEFYRSQGLDFIFNRK